MAKQTLTVIAAQTIPAHIFSRLHEDELGSFLGYSPCPDCKKDLRQAIEVKPYDSVLYCAGCAENRLAKNVIEKYTSKKRRVA